MNMFYFIFYAERFILLYLPTIVKVSILVHNTLYLLIHVLN